MNMQYTVKRQPVDTALDFKILVVEDNPADALLIREMLREPQGNIFALDQVSRLSDGLRQLEAGSYDLILLDLSLPDSYGFSTFRRFQEHAPHIPVIVLTGRDDKALALRAMRNGAQDYLVKGNIDGNLLQRSIRYAIERKRAADELRERTEHLEALRDVALDITSELDLSTLLHSITTRAVDLSGGNRGVLALYRPDLDAVELSVYVNIDPRPDKRIFRRGEGVAGLVLEREAPALITDYQAWEHSASPWDTYIGHDTVFGAPIRWRDELLGTLEVIGVPFQTLEDSRVELLTSFTTQAASAIRNVQLYEQEQQRRQEADTLREAALALTNTLERDVLIERILAQLQAVVPYDTASVQLLRDNALELVGGRGFPNLEELIGVTFDLNEDNPNRIVVREQEPHILSDAPEIYDEFHRDPHSAADIHSWLGVPLLVGQRLIGMIALDKHEADFYTGRHARLAEGFAAQAAIAIENAQLHAELRSHAEELEEVVADRTVELRAERAQLEAVLQGITDGIVLTNAEGETIQVNAVAKKWLTQDLAPDDAQRLREVIRSLARRVREQAALEEIIEFKGLDLEVKAAAVAPSPLHAGSAVVVIHDVSHLRALNRMKSRFVSSISHELRTPLTTMKLYVQMMRQQPQEWQQYLPVVEEEIDHQIQLVEQILEISRLDAGRLDIHPQPTALNDLTQIAVNNHEVLAEQHEVALSFEPAAPDPVAMVDDRRLMLVLNNLLRNAILYTEAGGAVRVATGLQVREDRRWATITVEDTGIGISEEEIPLIFERFYRGEEPRMLQISGNGLGLAIVKEIVELHGGRVEVESEVGVGSTFTVWLTLGEVKIETAPLPDV
jgi:signal transduction histidine kinase